MSFLFDLDDSSEAVVRFISSVRAELMKAFAHHKSRSGGSLQSLADKIGRDKSAVHRQLNGEGNLTLRTVAELSWALNKVPCFELRNVVVADEILSDYAICLPKMAAQKDILVFSSERDLAANSCAGGDIPLGMVA